MKDLSASTPKAPKARVIDIATTLDVEPVVTPGGRVLWATVETLYTAEILNPRVCIRVPLPYAEADSEAQRHELALRYARQLIDHACVTMGSVETPAAESPGIVEETVLAGLTQELGLAEPKTKPDRTLQR